MGMEMDYHDKYDLQQKDWRLLTEDAYELDRVKSRLPGNEYLPGYNPFLGDPEPFFNWGRSTRVANWHQTLYPTQSAMQDADLAHGDRIRANKKALGDPDWWKAGWDIKH